MPVTAEQILSRYSDLDDAKYALKLIESIRWKNDVQSEHFYIGIGYQNAYSSATDKTEEYYEIIDGVLVRKYYTTNLDWRFESPRTPTTADKVMNHTHLIFFSLNAFKAAVDAAKASASE